MSQNQDGQAGGKIAGIKPATQFHKQVNSRLNTSVDTNAPRGWKAAGVGLLAGAIAGVVMTTVMLLLHALLGVATPMPLIGDRLSAVIPVGPFLALMGKVGGYNHMKQLGVGSVIAGQLLVGAIGGWIYAIVIGRRSVAPSSRGRFSIILYVLLPVVVFAAALWPVLGTHYRGLPMFAAMLVTIVGLLLASSPSSARSFRATPG